MAANPGILTNWPWKPLCSFKYAIIVPGVAHTIHSIMAKGETEKSDIMNFEFMTTLFILVRYLHYQIWISVSRYQSARGYKRIVHGDIDFHQIHRENNWDDHMIVQVLLFYATKMAIPQASNLPIWRSDGIIMTILIHAGPVEFLYYWLHRALHHSYLYSRYHSHHHSSIVTQPITSVTHPFVETMAYLLLFMIPYFVVLLSGTSSLTAIFGYVCYIDFMNNMGHCNFEVIPKSLFSIFPPLKYLIYTPSFHSLHHTQFQTNYYLFVPFYDYVYNTVDKCSDELRKRSLEKAKDVPNVVHLTHFTTLNSIYQCRLGSSSLASRPQDSVWYLWILWPFTYFFMLFAWLFGRSFVLESNTFRNVESQTWYMLKWKRTGINKLIEEAIEEADRLDIKVLSLGLLNQAEELNRYGEIFVKKNPKTKVKIVDGSSLAAAVVLNSIPKGTTQLLFRGKFNKVAKAILSALSDSEIQVGVLGENEYWMIKQDRMSSNNVVSAHTYNRKIWLVGDGLTKEDQMKAAKGTIFIPFTQFPPKPTRKDCIYLTTPAMLAPASLHNLDSCENWLGRRVMSAWRIAGIIHALEGWKENEYGDSILNVQQIWKSALFHGFHPLPIPSP